MRLRKTIPLTLERIWSQVRFVAPENRADGNRSTAGMDGSERRVVNF